MKRQKREKLEPTPKGRLELDESILKDVTRWMMLERPLQRGKKSATADPVDYLRDGIRLYLELAQPLADSASARASASA